MYRVLKENNAVEQGGVEEIFPLCEVHCKLTGELNLRYVLYDTDGDSRDLYGTACEKIYCLRIVLQDIQRAIEECDLYDVSRDVDEALAMLRLFARERVTPFVAEEVMGELLAAR
ncbi:MAG: hypothetical protein IJY20_05835 [Clostridia bacterium]|nr:hypothetical protein [Clostridia bacterium]